MNAWHRTRINTDLERINTDKEYKGIMTWKRRNAFFVKCIAIILIFAFIYQDIVNAQGGMPVWATKANGAITPKAKQVNGFSVPHDLGNIQDGLENGGDEVIINIQDAHSNFGAQKSIAGILDNLVTNYNINLVAIEGSEGYIDTTLLSAFPDKKIKEDAANYLMKQGKISAGEFFSIMSEKQVPVYGIEDSSLYVENVKAFRKTVFQLLENEKNIDGLIKSLEALREHIYSKELLTLSKNSVLNKTGEISFSDYWDYLHKLGEKYNIRYDEYGSLSLLAEVRNKEKEIDFDKADRQRKELIDVLSKKISKTELEDLVLKSVNFKLGKISTSDFHIQLIELADKYKVNHANYKDLIKYTEYISIYDYIDIVGVFSEIKHFEGIIKEKIFKNDNQRKLDSLLLTAYLLKDLFQTKLSNGSYAELINVVSNIKKNDFIDFIKQNYKRYKLVYEGDFDITIIFGNIPDALEFYRLAEERNQAMFNNTLKRMREKGEKVAALVTGGFHTEGLTNLFRQKKLSYIVIAPKIDEDAPERPVTSELRDKMHARRELIYSL